MRQFSDTWSGCSRVRTGYRSRVRCLANLLAAVCCCLSAVPQLAVAGGLQSDIAESAEYFEREIRPILQQRCVECHSRTLASENGDLDLETVEGIAAGGSRGGLFAGTGEAAGKGLLLQAVEYADPDLQMPPSGRLPASEIAKLQQWVRAGAVLPQYTAKPRPAATAIDFSAAAILVVSSAGPDRPSDGFGGRGSVGGWCD